ncbi:MAG TPA: hypothetical protein VMU14_16610 [Acidimicrobiales bacterium]|nr:hypothetical protein [Acidimicrobiales bacterium]
MVWAVASTWDRRAVLRLAAGGVGLAAGATALGACSGGGGGSELVLLPNDWDFFAGTPYRLAFFVADNAHNAAPVALDSPLTLRIAREGAPYGPPVPTVVHANGPEPNYALATYTFPAPGTYNVRASFKGHTLALPLTVTAPSASATPTVGQKMVAVATPTTTDHRGVNPICTAQPACPFHAVSLDQALEAGRPVALQFATPALCQSKFCGPVLSNLVAVSGPWRDRVAFIHAEIYTDLSGQTSTPAVTAWGLQHEPMLYLGDATGRIVTRIDNLYDQDEARAALTGAYGAPAG